MPSKIILKKSSVAAKAPVAGDLDFGELAINYTDSKLYFKKADGSIDAFSSAAASAPVTSVGGNIGAITDAQLLASIKNVDGTGSGLDADFLDGNSAAAFYLATNPNGYTSNAGTVTSVGATAPIVSSGGTTPSLSIAAANSTTNGYMTSAYASKLDGIAAGAQVNVATNLAQGTRTTTAVPITSSTGTTATLDIATTLLAGVMSSADKTKLDGIATGATANTGTVTGVTATAPVASSGGTAPVISMAVASSGVNGYMTGAYATKLDGIAAGATNVTNTNQLTNGAGYITSSGSISGNAATATRTSGVSGYAHAGTGMYPFYNWGGTDGGTSAPTASTYTTGISVGSNPGDQAYGFQIANNMWQTGLWTRNYNSSFGTWYRILDTANYNSYSPTLTGGGASGTWGISISGNAATATSATNATTAGGLSVHAGRNNEANKIVRTDANGYIQAGWINTDSGDSGISNRLTRIYSSHDAYLRYSGLTDFKVHMGLSAKNNYSRAVDYTTDANYHVGSIGHSGYGANETFHGGSAFFDIWSGSNYPSGTSHIHGFNALHYTVNSLGSTGNTAYGIQVAGQYNLGGEIWSRGCSGGTFSAWRLQLDSSNYNSYSPTLTGGGASGTWGINITGNAATATSAVQLTGTQPNLGYSISGQNIDYAGQGGPQVQSQGSGAAMMSFHRPGSYAINFGLGTDNQLRTGGWSRGGNYVILDAANYTSYAPSLTGGGASGTWGISISGNAATASNGGVTSVNGSTGAVTVAAGISTVNYNNDSNSTYQMIWGSGNAIYGTAGIYCNPSSDYLYATAFSATSDETLKTNWRDLPNNFIEELSKVKSGTYDRIDVEVTQDGVSAQSLQKILPNSVMKGQDDKLSVNYGNAALVSSIELAKRIVEQDKKIARLEALVLKLIEG